MKIETSAARKALRFPMLRYGAVALLSAVFLFALPLLQADDHDDHDDRDRGDDHHDGGGGIGISIDIGQIFNALSHSDDEKKKIPPPKKADDDDCPERYKALLALLNSLSPVVQALADSIKDCQAAVDAEGDARSLLNDANIGLINAIMNAERHPNDAGAAQAVADAQKAVDAAKAAFQKTQDQVKAAQDAVADCAEAYAAALKQYDAALAAYNYHCRDYKPGPPFPPYPNGGIYTPPSISAPPDVPIPPGVGPGPSTPGGNPSTPGGGPSTPGGNPSAPGGNGPSTPGGSPSTPGNTPSIPGNNPTTPGNSPTTPGNTPSTPGNSGPSNPGNGPANPGGGPSTPGSDSGPTVVPPSPHAPGPPPEPPSGSPSTPGVMTLDTDDCPERLKKLLADMAALNQMMQIILALESQIGLDQEKYQQIEQKLALAEFLSWGSPPQPSQADEQALRQLSLEMMVLNLQEQQVQVQAKALLKQITAEAAAYREHCGEPPPFTGTIPLIPLGPGSVYVGVPLGDECAELLKKVRAAQADMYLKAQQFYTAMGALDAARQRVVDLAQAANDAQNAATAAEDNVANTFYQSKNGEASSSDVSNAVDKMRDARDKADQASSDLKNSPEYAAAVADEKAKDAAFSAAFKTLQASEAAFSALEAEYQKHCGKYPYEQVQQDLEQQYGPEDPRDSGEKNGVPNVKGDLGGPVDENL